MLNEILEKKIKNKIVDASVKIFSSNKKYFNMIIITDFFEKKSLLERQQLIYNIINKYITNKEIHAISFKTYTKKEWSDENKK